MANAEKLPVEVEADAQLEIDAETTDAVESEVTENQPESEPQGSVPLSKHTKLRERAQQAEHELERLQREKQALKQERDVAMLGLKKEPETEAVLTPPNPDDYYGDSEGYSKAFNEWNIKNTEQIVKQSRSYVDQTLQNQQQSAIEASEAQQRQKEFSGVYDAYLDRADKLQADDFMEAQTRLHDPETGLGVWSKQFLDGIIEGFENSEQIIYALGNDTDKALELAKGYDANNIVGGKRLIEFAGSLDPIKKSGEILEADEPIKGGAGGMTNVQSEMDKKIAASRKLNQEGKRNMTEHLAYVRKLKAGA